ncbi:hypothetical protein ACM26V_22685 [Salipaludibacillus sp. HK11]|uniref:hypothetical protein n=1 Tax=Salipaludibacillus sp. HK11 TaxID=3394320 RepID=UPI0039FDD367
MKKSISHKTFTGGTWSTIGEPFPFSMLQSSENIPNSEAFGAFEEWKFENVPYQRGIRSVTGIEFEKRSVSARDSERYRNKDWKSFRISKAFGALQESKLRNSPHCESGFSTFIEFKFFF